MIHLRPLISPLPLAGEVDARSASGGGSLSTSKSGESDSLREAPSLPPPQVGGGGEMGCCDLLAPLAELQHPVALHHFLGRDELSTPFTRQHALLESLADVVIPKLLDVPVTHFHL